MYDKDWSHWFANNGFEYTPSFDENDVRDFGDLKDSPFLQSLNTPSEVSSATCVYSGLIIKTAEGKVLEDRSDDGPRLPWLYDESTQTWSFIPVAGGLVRLRSAQQRHVEDREGAARMHVASESEKLGDWQTWELSEGNVKGRFGFRSYHSRYLAPNHNDVQVRGAPFQEWSIATADGVPPCVPHQKSARFAGGAGIFCVDITPNGARVGSAPCVETGPNGRAGVMINDFFNKIVPLHHGDKTLTGVALMETNDETSFSQEFLDLMRRSRVAVSSSNACLPPKEDVQNFMSSIIHVADFEFLGGGEGPPGHDPDWENIVPNIARWDEPINQLDWENKIDEVRFRGEATGNNVMTRNSRILVSRMSKDYKPLNAYVMGTVQLNDEQARQANNEGLVQSGMSREEMLQVPGFGT